MMIPCEAWLRYHQKKPLLSPEEVTRILGKKLKENFLKRLNTLTA